MMPDDQHESKLDVLVSHNRKSLKVSHGTQDEEQGEVAAPKIKDTALNRDLIVRLIDCLKNL